MAPRQQLIDGEVDARRLVCERDGGCFVTRACQQLHEPRPAAPLRSARRITAMAPTTSIWRRYRLPALVMPGRTLLPEEFAIVTSRCLMLLSLDKSEWSPEGDYFPEGDRFLMFKPEVHMAEWSVT
jgi:hypothetical protein